MTYNPTSPTVVGEEWRPTVGGTRSLGDAATGWADRFTASVSEADIAGVRLYLSAAQPGRYALDIYETGDEELQAAEAGVLAQYLPSADVENGNTFGLAGRWADPAGNQVIGAFYAQLADPDPATFLQSVAPAGDHPIGARYRFSVASGGAVDGQRPAYLTIKLRLASFGGNDVQLFMYEPSTGLGRAWNVPYFGDQTLTLPVPDINPFTNRPWTAADIREFAPGGAYQFIIDEMSYAPNPTHVIYFEFDVTWVTEYRKAVGAAWVAGAGWIDFPLIDAADSSGVWTGKSAGVDYTLLLRRCTDAWSGAVGAIGWSYLKGAVCPQASHRSASCSLLGYGAPSSATEFEDAAAAVILHDSGGVASVDSQPFAALRVAAVDVGGSIDQELEPQSTAAYGSYRMLVKPRSRTVLPLTAQVYQVSNHAAFGSTVQLTVAQANALPDVGGGWKLWQANPTSPPALVSGTLYELELACADPAGSTTGWSVAYLDTIGQGQAETYEGTTCAAKVRGTRSTSWDAPMTVGELPPTITGLAAVEQWLDRGDVGLDDSCAITAVSCAALSWDGTVLGVSFASYCVERSDDGGSSWQKIASITNESVVGILDVEPLRGVEVQYRVSAVLVDGTAGEPSDVASVTCELQQGDEWVFATNEDVDKSLALQVRPSQVFNRVQKPVEQLYYGRDDVVTFRPIERDGDRFTLAALVSGPGVAAWGRQVFDALVALCEAEISYVAVISPDGRRWFATCVPHDMANTEPGHIGVAMIDVVESSSVPAVVDAVQALYPVVVLYGLTGSGGTLTDAEFTSSGHTFEFVPIDDWPIAPRTDFYLVTVAPNGRVMIGSITTTYGNGNPTGDSQTVMEWSPAERQLRTTYLETTEGETIVDGPTTPGKGGGDVSDFTVVEIGGVPYLLANSQTNYFGWEIAQHGLYRALILLEEQPDGTWAPDYTRSYTYDDLRVLAGVDGPAAFPTTVNTFGETHVAGSGLNETCTLPHSGHVAIANYFGNGGVGYYGAAVHVYDQATGALVGYFELPKAITDGHGNDVGLSVRAITADPSSSVNDERFAVFFDMFSPGSVVKGVPFMEFSYDASTGDLAPTSALIRPQHVDSGGGPGVYLPDGTFLLGVGNPTGFFTGSLPMHGYFKSGGERSFVTAQPYDVATTWGSNFGVAVAPDFHLSAVAGGSMLGPIFFDEVLRMVVAMGIQGRTLWATLPDPFVLGAELVTNGAATVNIAGWVSMFLTGTVAWNAAHGGCCRMNCNAGASAEFGIGFFDLGSDAGGKDFTFRIKAAHAGTQRNVHIIVEWYNDTLSFPTGFLGSTVGSSYAEPASSADMIELTAGATAPAGTTHARLALIVENPGAGELHDAKDASMKEVPLVAHGEVHLDVTSLPPAPAGDISAMVPGGIDDRHGLWMATTNSGSGDPDAVQNWLYRVDLPQLLGLPATADPFR